jgi:hypothetical protein
MPNYHCHDQSDTFLLTERVLWSTESGDSKALCLKGSDEAKIVIEQKSKVMPSCL